MCRVPSSPMNTEGEGATRSTFPGSVNYASVIFSNSLTLNFSVSFSQIFIWLFKYFFIRIKFVSFHALITFFYLGAHLYSFLFKFFFWFLHTNLSSPSLLSSHLLGFLHPVPIHNLEELRPSLRWQQSPVYQVESGPSPCHLILKLSKVSYHREFMSF